jgi:hypothetical protein
MQKMQIQPPLPPGFKLPFKLSPVRKFRRSVANTNELPALRGGQTVGAAAREKAMRLGAMQDYPLRVMRLMDHAEREHGSSGSFAHGPTARPIGQIGSA